jgi:hypothetical protein
MFERLLDEFKAGFLEGWQTFKSLNELPNRLLNSLFDR